MLSWFESQFDYKISPRTYTIHTIEVLFIEHKNKYVTKKKNKRQKVQQAVISLDNVSYFDFCVLLARKLLISN